MCVSKNSYPQLQWIPNIMYISIPSNGYDTDQHPYSIKYHHHFPLSMAFLFSATPGASKVSRAPGCRTAWRTTSLSRRSTGEA